MRVRVLGDARWQFVCEGTHSDSDAASQVDSLFTVISFSRSQ